jgi:hypothetical protein
MFESIRTSEPPPSLLELRGGNTRRLKARLKRIRRTAEDVRVLCRTFAGRLAAVGADGLPQKLEEFASGFEEFNACVRVSKFGAGDVALANLAAYVKFCTHRAHNREVSEISAHLLHTTFPYDAYLSWKRRRKRLISLFTKQLSDGILRIPV